MTIISALKVNPQEAILIADEQGSMGNRKADLYTKVARFEPNDKFKAIIGGAGSVTRFDAAIPGINEILLRAKEDPSMKGLTFAKIVSRSLVSVRRDAINGYFLGQLGLTEHQIQAGYRTVDGEKIPISQEIISHYHKILNEGDYMVSTLILTSLEGNVDLYSTTSENTEPIVSSNASMVIGSGADAAHMELTGFLESRPREKRTLIEPVEGLVALLSAIDLARRRNVGVGGTPNIYIFNKGKLINPSENSSHLAVEIVRATKAGYLTEKFQSEALRKLLYDNYQIDSVEVEMFDQVPLGDKNEFSRFLRGYK
jgi:hypothetical protein